MRRRILITLTLLVALSLAAILPLCDLMFRCGCTLASGEGHCNVHEPRVPHCPWCEGRAWAFLPGYLTAMGLASGLSWMSLRRARSSIGFALACGIVAYGLIMSLGGLVTAKVMHYPVWFGWRV